MKLYHAGLSTCSQKVRMVLAEKGLSYESEFIDLQAGGQFRPEYLALNPNGVVPTLEDAGAVFIESTLINEYLEDAYPEIRLRPDDAAGAYRMRLWSKKIDELHPACGVQTYAIGVRPGLMKRATEEVDALVENIPDPVRRATRRSVIDHGVAAPEFAAAYRAHEKTFAAAEATLNEDAWLAGGEFSLADAGFLPYVLRVEHLGLQRLLEDLPALQDWYRRVQERPAYQTAVADFLPEPAVAAFRRGGAAATESVDAVLNAAS